MPRLGVSTLLSQTITTAVSAVTPDGNKELGYHESLLLQANFTYGSGGTNFKAWVQTSLDGGTTWTDVANFAGTTSSIRRIFHLTPVAVTTIATPTDGTLADGTAVNGILGPLYRVKLTTTGTYAGGTTLVITAVAK